MHAASCAHQTFFVPAQHVGRAVCIQPHSNATARGASLPVHVHGYVHIDVRLQVPGYATNRNSQEQRLRPREDFYGMRMRDLSLPLPRGLTLPTDPGMQRPP